MAVNLVDKILSTGNSQETESEINSLGGLWTTPAESRVAFLGLLRTLAESLSLGTSLWITGITIAALLAILISPSFSRAGFTRGQLDGRRVCLWG